MMLTISDPTTGHRAYCLFGVTSTGSPAESLDHFLKQLRKGEFEQPIEKVSKSGPSPKLPPPWNPMNCGDIDLHDDFRPFVKRRLKRVKRAGQFAEYAVES